MFPSSVCRFSSGVFSRRNVSVKKKPPLPSGCGGRVSEALPQLGNPHPGTISPSPSRIPRIDTPAATPRAVLTPVLTEVNTGTAEDANARGATRRKGTTLVRRVKHVARDLALAPPHVALGAPRLLRGARRCKTKHERF